MCETVWKQTEPRRWIPRKCKRLSLPFHNKALSYRSENTSRLIRSSVVSCLSREWDQIRWEDAAAVMLISCQHSLSFSPGKNRSSTLPEKQCLHVSSLMFPCSFITCGWMNWGLYEWLKWPCPLCKSSTMKLMCSSSNECELRIVFVFYIMCIYTDISTNESRFWHFQSFLTSSHYFIPLHSACECWEFSLNKAT